MTTNELAVYEKNRGLALFEKAYKVIPQGLPEGLRDAIVFWADSTTDAKSKRRLDLLRDKTRAVSLFFEWAGKAPDKITPQDVKEWQVKLETVGLGAYGPVGKASVYALISRISSFYTWAQKESTIAAKIGDNPVILARPKAPKAYQNKSVQALEKEDAVALLRYVKGKADSGSIVGKRDFAILQLFFATGCRRAEIISLTWGDLKINHHSFVMRITEKGGDMIPHEIDDKRVLDALLDYLTASGRLDTLKADDPVWTRHDRAGKPGKALTSHAFVKNLKRYAGDKGCGIGYIHLHQTRHTAAERANDKGGIAAAQYLLGHKSQATTRGYLRRIAIKRDRHSKEILDWLEL